MKPKKISKKHETLRNKFLEEYEHSTPMKGVKKEKRIMYKFILKLFKIR